MDIKRSAQVDSASEETPTEKPDISHIEALQHDHHLSKSDKVHAVDDIIARPDVSLETFSHLDIKKILWKIDVRLIPMVRDQRLEAIA